MRNFIEIAGHKVVLEQADLDQDGKVGGVETIRQSFNDGTTIPQEKTELGDVMDKAFPKDPKSIKQLGNIEQMEERYLFLLSAFVRLDFLPRDCEFLVEEWLALSNSRSARGRNDIRDISTGKREHDAKVGMTQAGKNLTGLQ